MVIFFIHTNKNINDCQWWLSFMTRTLTPMVYLKVGKPDLKFSVSQVLTICPLLSFYLSERISTY